MSKRPESESNKALEAFNEYCMQGTDRSLEKLHAQYAKRAEDARREQGKKSYVPSLSTLKNWSSTHAWQDRVKAYDEQVLKDRRRKHEAELEKMNARHAQIGLSMQLEMVKEINRALKAGEFDTRSAVSLLKLATDLERLALGAATTIEQHQGPDGKPIEIYQVPQVRLPDNGR